MFLTIVSCVGSTTIPSIICVASSALSSSSSGKGISFLKLTLIRNKGVLYLCSFLLATRSSMTIVLSVSIRGTKLRESDASTSFSKASLIMVTKKSFIMISTILKKRVKRLHSDRNAARSINVILWLAVILLAFRNWSTTWSQAIRTLSNTVFDNASNFTLKSSATSCCILVNSSTSKVCPFGIFKIPMLAIGIEVSLTFRRASLSGAQRTNKLVFRDSVDSPILPCRRPVLHTLNAFQRLYTWKKWILLILLNMRASRSHCSRGVNWLTRSL